MWRFILGLLVPICCFCVPAPANRLPSAPFITGDTFRFFADFVYDEIDRSLDPEQIKHGSTIFLKTDYLSEFFARVHPRIKKPYVLITHNSDYAAPGNYGSYLEDSKLLAWFAQNYDGYPHPKMHPIPIGIANYHWGHGNYHHIQQVQSDQIGKEHLAYLNIAIGTFPQEREKAFNLLVAQNFCYLGKNRSHKEFLKDLARSQFVISPRGNGLDTHRLWEALYVGSIPVVKTSPLDALYEGLPVLIVSDWEQVTAQFLEEKLSQLKKQNFSMEKVYIDYWLRLINSYKLN